MQSPKPRGPSPIQEILRTLLRDQGLTAQPRDERVFQVWQRALGPQLAEHARPVRFRRGELTVEVDSAAHLQELEGFTGERFRKAANAELGAAKIRRVAYKLRG